MELQALQEALPEITKAGASLVAISPETAANSRKATWQNELSFPIVTDFGNEIAAAYRLRFKLPIELVKLYCDTFKNGGTSGGDLEELGDKGGLCGHAAPPMFRTWPFLIIAITS